MALVLDDLDKITPTERAVQPLYLAINRWVEARQPPFVTTNTSPALRRRESLSDSMDRRDGPPVSRLAVLSWDGGRADTQCRSLGGPETGLPLLRGARHSMSASRVPAKAASAAPNVP